MPEEGGLQKVFLGKKSGVDQHVLFRVIPGPDFVRDTNTVFVIHGWNGKADDFNKFASAIKESSLFGPVQVITVDWVAARTGVPNLYGASNWIDGMGELISNQVNSWGISPSRINIAGHSLGAYVAYEVAERLDGINLLYALNPASTTAFGYNILQVNFSKYSNWSSAFWNNGDTDNLFLTHTADESFEIKLGWTINPAIGHGSAKDVLTNILLNRGVARDFINSSCPPRSGFEGEIEADRNFIPTKFRCRN